MDLTEFYDTGYHNKIHAGMIADREYYDARAWILPRMYFTDADRRGRVLDYGCGLGQLIAELPDAAGYDASAEARMLARAHGISVYDMPGDIPPASFDIVICRHALEHFPDPLAVLRQLRCYLKPSGKLILVLAREKHHPATLEPDGHMHLFTWNFRSINNLVAVAGMRATHNGETWTLGHRQLLPVKRLFGARAYEIAAAAVGRWYRNGEIVIHAVPQD